MVLPFLSFPLISFAFPDELPPQFFHVFCSLASRFQHPFPELSRSSRMPQIFPSGVDFFRQSQYPCFDARQLRLPVKPRGASTSAGVSSTLLPIDKIFLFPPFDSPTFKS